MKTHIALGVRRLVFGLLLISPLFLQPAAVLANHDQSNVGVRITIEHVKQVGGCFDPACWLGGEADFYAHMEIDAAVHQTAYKGDSNSISPNWIFEQPAVLGANSASILIQIWDRDGGFRGDDDKGDIHPFGGKNLEGQVEWDFDANGPTDVPPGCACITDARLRINGADPDGGDYVQTLVQNGPEGFFGEPLTFSGNSGDKARIRFRVDLVIPPGVPIDDPGVKIRPLGIHSPIHPSKTDLLTITGGVVDEFGQAVNTLDTIEIWFDEDGIEPRPNAPLLKCPGASPSSCSATVDLSAVTTLGDQIAYGVFAWNEATHSGRVWSGWRITTVGNPGNVDVIPISVGTRPTSNAVDILLIPDGIDYFTGGKCDTSIEEKSVPEDSDFTILMQLVDCDGTLDNSIWSPDLEVLLAGTIFSSVDWSQATASNPANILPHSDILLFNQRKFNIWYTTVPAVVTREPDPENDPHCDVKISTEFLINNGGFDVKAVIHRTKWRDCAPVGVFTSEPGNTTAGFNARSLSTFIHELGHSPFRNADIYCCTGGYFQNNVSPNLYSEKEDSEFLGFKRVGCDNDPLLGNPGIPSPAANPGPPCQDSFTDTHWGSADWFRPEPANSIMGSHNQTDPGTNFYAQFGPSSVNRIQWYLGKCDDGRC